MPKLGKQWLYLPLVAVGLWAGCASNGASSLEESDMYDVLVAACRETGPKGQVVSEGCRAAWKSVLPSSESLDHAPEEILKEWYEVFRNALFVPLAVPEKGMLWGEQAGLIPLQYLCLFRPDMAGSACTGTADPSLNRVLLHYILSQVDEFRYVPTTKDDPIYGNYKWEWKRIVNLHTPFWGERTPWMIKLTVLAHEAGHASGSYHVSCALGSGRCDVDMNGAYGIEAVVSAMMLAGEGQQYRTQQPLFFTDSELIRLGTHLCDRVKHIMYTSPHLQEALPTKCSFLSGPELTKATQSFGRPLDESLPTVWESNFLLIDSLAEQ